MSDFLLVEVTGPDESNELEAWLGSFPVVVSVSVHGDGCCCQHCPHQGNCRD
jgi:hypothetical protein